MMRVEHKWRRASEKERERRASGWRARFCLRLHRLVCASVSRAALLSLARLVSFRCVSPACKCASSLCAQIVLLWQMCVRSLSLAAVCVRAFPPARSPALRELTVCACFHVAARLALCCCCCCCCRRRLRCLDWWRWCALHTGQQTDRRERESERERRETQTASAQIFYFLLYRASDSDDLKRATQCNGPQCHAVAAASERACNHQGARASGDSVAPSWLSVTREPAIQRRSGRRARAQCGSELRRRRRALHTSNFFCLP